MTRVVRGLFPAVERCEQLVFVALNLHLIAKLWPTSLDLGGVFRAAYVLDQTLVVVFLLVRRPPQTWSTRPADHVIAVASTLLPLLALPASQQPMVPLQLAFMMLIAGTLLHLSAKLSLRRSFGVLPANRGVKTEGVYRLVRHPMYLGYAIVQASLVLAGPVTWNVVLFVLNSALIVARIHAEERLLGQSPEYRAFCKTTRYRLIPGVY